MLLWFQARDSLTEHEEQQGCLKVMFSHTATHTHIHTHVLKGLKTFCGADSLLPLSVSDCTNLT